MNRMVICGKEFPKANIEQIRHIIAENGQKSRTLVSRQVCEALDWHSPNGSREWPYCTFEITSEKTLAITRTMVL